MTLATLPGVTQPDPNAGRLRFTATLIACPACGTSGAGEARGWFYCGSCKQKGPMPPQR